MPVYSEFVIIPEGGIDPSLFIEYSPAEADSSLILSGNYDLVLVVRYTKQCPSESLDLNLEEISLSQEKSDSTRMLINLFNSKGRPIGKGGYGVYEIRDTLHHAFAMPEGYSLSVSSNTPAESTKGIKSLGLVISRH